MVCVTQNKRQQCQLVSKHELCAVVPVSLKHNDGHFPAGTAVSGGLHAVAHEADQLSSCSPVRGVCNTLLHPRHSRRLAPWGSIERVQCAKWSSIQQVTHLVYERV